jgi:hypothetical protein
VGCRCRDILWGAGVGIYCGVQVWGYIIINVTGNRQYSSAPVSMGNTFQDLPRLRETTDNTERYI